MPRQTVSSERTSALRSESRVRSENDAGPNGRAIAAPVYGIDVLIPTVSEEPAEYTAPNGVPQRQATSFSTGNGTNGTTPLLTPTIPDLASALPSPVVTPAVDQLYAAEPIVEENVETEISAEQAAGGGATAASGSIAPTEGEDVLLVPEPPADLSPEEQQRLQQAQGRVGGAAGATSVMPSAETQVGEARGAVEEPETETQARADSALVAALEQRPEPSPEIEALCNRIYDIIRSMRPPDEESLVDADPSTMAAAAGGQLNESVEGDTERVQGSYDELQEPQEGSPLQEPQAMDAPPMSVDTPDINAAAATPDGVSDEDVSLESDVEANRLRQEEAGMTSAAAQVITDPSNPVTQAQAAQGELEETSAREPAAVMAEQQEALAGASADMLALQAQALAALQSSRSSTVTGTHGQQLEMVGSEEQIRTQVSARAQSIVDSARTQVETLLRPLSQTAMQRWETGVVVLSTRFERQLARVAEWIEERHSGVGGAILSVADYLTGLPDWVTEEYNAAERAFGDGVCDLIREISTEVNGVIAAAEALIADANDDVDELFDSLPAELQEWASGERERFGQQLNDLHNQVQEARQNINQQLSDRASGAVQQVRERIHQLRQEAGGLVGRIVDAVNRFLEDPAKFIIEGILTILGIPPASFWAVVARIQQVISDIADDPLGFAGNLLAALAQGFQQFFDNIGSHLLQGLLDWLFSGLGSVGVELPSDLSLKSIVTFFLQLMGITWSRIRELLARHIGEENVALIERAWELVSMLIEQGPQGIFDMLREQFDPQRILDMVMEAAIDFITEALIVQVTTRIIALFNPVGAIAQAIEAIYRVLRWIFENAARIFSLVETIVNGIADILAGNIGGMANAVEQALAGLIAPVIDFLANYVSLGNLPERIADVIRRMQDWVEGILDRIIGFLANQARRLLSAIGLGGEADRIETGDPEHDAAVTTGLAAIAPAEQPFLQSGKIARQDADTVASTVRGAHPIFSRLVVVDGGDSWNYEWSASDGDEHDTASMKAETTVTSSFEGRRITEQNIAEELTAAGYRRPYQRDSRWIIARRDASSGVPRLSVGSDAIITGGPTEDESDRGEIIVELNAIMSSLEPHPHLELFRIDPTGGRLRLGSSLRREALSRFRPRTTDNRRQAIEELMGAEDEIEDLIEIPIGGAAELEIAEQAGMPHRMSGSGLRATGMSGQLIDQFIVQFVGLTSGEWPAGWEVHHVIPTDWGGNDNVSNYAAIPAAKHQDITNWWNRLRSMILHNVDAAAARADGTTTEYQSLRFE